MKFTADVFTRRIAQSLPGNAGTPSPAKQEAADSTAVADLSELWTIRDDEAFLREAYRLILGRECDISGSLHYREMLHRGVSRRVIAHHLANSEEARAGGRRYEGLSELLVAAEKVRLRGTGGVTSAWAKTKSRLYGLYRLLAQVPLLERIDNKLNVLLDEGERRSDRLSLKSDENLWTISTKLDNYVSDLKDRQEELRECVLVSAARLDRLAGRTRNQEERAVVFERTLLAHFEHLTKRLGQIEDTQAMLRNLSERHESSVQTVHAQLADRQRELELRQDALALLQERSDTAHAQLADLQRELGSRQDALALLQERSDTERRAVEEQLTEIAHRIRPPVLRAGNDVLVTEVDGFILGLPSAEWRLAAYHVFRGVLEPGLVRLFQRLVRPGMVIVDVGANIGIYTLYAARLLAGQGRVFSFEPAPNTFAILRDNVQVNGFLESGLVHLNRQAVLDRTGSARLTVYPNDGGHNTLFPGTAGGDSVEVDAVSLDDFLIGSDRMDVVKIDAEGAEPFILRGMRRILAHNPQLRILMEFAPQHLDRAGVAPADFLAELRSAGLDFAIVDDVTGALVRRPDESLPGVFSANLVLSRAPIEGTETV